MALASQELWTDAGDLIHLIWSPQRLMQGVRNSEHPRRRLYHYTNADGLQGIAGTGQIWATNTRYLNDEQEIDYAHNLAAGFLYDKQRKTGSKFVGRLIEYVLDFLEQRRDSELYVASFCEEYDLLSQWRGYGRGVGYNLGVDPVENLLDLVWEGDYRIVKVIYDRDEQISKLEAVLSPYVDPDSEVSVAKCDRWLEHDSDDFWDFMRVESKTPRSSDPPNAKTVAQTCHEVVREAALSLVDKLELCFLSFKHAGFREEREWRFVYTPNPRFTYEEKFRTANGYLVPYVELPLLCEHPALDGKAGASHAAFKLRQVTVGPCNAPDAARRSVEKWLIPRSPDGGHLAHFDEVVVLTSSTPFRTW